MASKTLKLSRPGGAGARLLVFLIGIPMFLAFRAFAGGVIDAARANGGAGSDPRTAWIFGIGGGVIALAIIAAWVGAIVGGTRESSYQEVMDGLRAWVARHGWEVTDDPRLAAQWAARFRFSANDLTSPSVAARGWVHGRDAMILFCDLGTGERSAPRTLIAVDAGANYTVTAVVRRRHASSHDYGVPIPLESIDFERRWRAMGWDAATAHAIFTPRVIERLLQPISDGQPEIVWDGPGIRSADAAYIAEPMHLESRLLLLADLAGLTPAYQVTHANDPQSLPPYVPPRGFRFTATLVDGAQMVKALGVLAWWIGVMMAFAPFATAAKVVVVAVCAVVGLALFLSGGRLERFAKVRRLEQWRATHAPPLGPPPSPPRPSPPPLAPPPTWRPPPGP